MKEFITVALIPESIKPKGNYLPRERVLKALISRAVTTSYSQMPWYLVSDIPKSTNMQSKFIKNISLPTKIMATSQKSMRKNSPILTSSSAASLAKVLASPVKDVVLPIPEVLSFLKSVESLNKSNHVLYSLRTSEGFYLTTKGELLPLSSPRLMTWGMTVNGKCLTAKISASRKIGSASSLSDILEERPDPKYFLSAQMVKRLITYKDTSRTLLPPVIGGGQATGSYIEEGQFDAQIGTLRTHKDGRGFRKIKSGLSPTIPARAREDGSGQPILAYALKARHDGGIDKKHPQTLVRVKEATVGDSINLSVMDSKTRRGRIGKGVAQTLDTGMQQHTLDRLGGVRRLTPTECERLQGFPDSWTAIVSDTQRYKTLGNAVTVNVIQAICERLLYPHTVN